MFLLIIPNTKSKINENTLPQQYRIRRCHVFFASFGISSCTSSVLCLLWASHGPPHIIHPMSCVRYLPGLIIYISVPIWFHRYQIVPISNFQFEQRSYSLIFTKKAVTVIVNFKEKMWNNLNLVPVEPNWYWKIRNSWLEKHSGYENCGAVSLTFYGSFLSKINPMYGRDISFHVIFNHIAHTQPHCHTSIFSISLTEKTTPHIHW